MVFVHHLLQSFILPPFNGVILITIGFILLNYRLKLAKSFIVIGCIFIYLQSIPFTVYTIASLIEKPTISKDELSRIQAFVVLGGGVRTNAYEYEEKFAANSHTLVRLQYVAYLAKQFPKIPIILSGGIATPNSIHSEANIMKYTLQNQFHVTNTIITEDASRNTKENAQYTNEILKKLHITKIALISQAFHLNRANAIFKKYGLVVYNAPTDYMVHYNRLITLASFIPDAQTMEDCATILHELIGYVQSL